MNDRIIQSLSPIDCVAYAIDKAHKVLNNWDGCAWIEHIHFGGYPFGWEEVPHKDRHAHVRGLYMGCVFCGSPVSSGHFDTCKFAEAKAALKEVRGNG
jgi:hypothetical protein